MALNDYLTREQDTRTAQMMHTPTFLVVAGSLPGLYAATNLENGIAVGVVSAVVMLCMMFLAPMLKAFTGTWSRAVVMVCASVTVATLCGFAVCIADPVVFESLGIYLPLSAVNAIAVSFMLTDGPALEGKSTWFAGTFAALTTLCSLAFIGLINGMLATGKIFGLTMNELAASPIAIFAKPAGSLLVLALVAAFVQSVEQVCAKSAAEKAVTAQVAIDIDKATAHAAAHAAEKMMAHAADTAKATAATVSKGSERS